ncbi:LPD29 domain-containing protein [Variovorax paradoxus]|jgi:hypothetical protein|uniref:LPD29 domain-containing protein n=1 Tax=Variovorax paradoxus TaxID=34073 RepID=UPI0004266A7E
MTKYISCAETAKLIRKALKESFPGIKFSVRSSVYSGGASVSVGWTDGPNRAQVEAVAGVFKGAYFDGSIDLKGSTYALIDGEQVSFGADYVFCRREYSDAMVDKAIAAVCRFWGIPLVATADDFSRGLLNGMNPGNYGRDLSTLIHQQLGKMSDRLAVAKSKTAGKVIYLGNDGHSQTGALSSVVV